MTPRRKLELDRASYERLRAATLRRLRERKPKQTPRARAFQGVGVTMRREYEAGEE